MSVETLTAYLEHKERMLERQQRAQMELMEQKLRHEKELAHQKLEYEMQKLQIEKTPLPNKESESGAKYKGPKVPKFEEGQDIDSYLHTFEKLAEFMNGNQTHGRQG